MPNEVELGLNSKKTGASSANSKYFTPQGIHIA
jgi:hypothetical protein